MRVLSYPGDDNNEGTEPLVSYILSHGRNFFLWQQAWKYRNEMLFQSEETAKERKERSKKEGAILLEEFGGDIKIHYTNNKKLKRVGAGQRAAEIQNDISQLRQHLQAKQEERKRGLGALIRNRYAKGRPAL